MARRLGWFAVAALVAVSIVPTTFAAANDAKVFVCKYVVTPGEGEVLQTGDNPISVSVNTLDPAFTGDPNTLIGASFTDGQGRSYVIAVDVGQDEPPARDACPPPTVAPPTEAPPTDAPPTEAPPTGGVLPTEGVPTEAPTTTPAGGVAGATATPGTTLPPTDTLGDSAAATGSDGWRVILLALAATLAAALLLTPARVVRKDR